MGLPPLQTSEATERIIIQGAFRSFSCVLVCCLPAPFRPRAVSPLFVIPLIDVCRFCRSKLEPDQKWDRRPGGEVEPCLSPMGTLYLPS